MLVKSQVKYIQSLGQKKVRDEEGVFVAEGPKMVSELLRAGNLRPVQVLAVREKEGAGYSWLMPEGSGGPAAPRIDVTEIKQEELERVSFLSTPNQVLAVFEKPRFERPRFDEAVSVLLDGIQDPGNLGTIVRIADWFGIPQVVCSPDSADVYNPKAIQSTMGSICRVQVVYADLPSLVDQYPGLPVCSALLNGQSIYGMERLQKGWVVIGNESKGVREELLRRTTRAVTIPGSGQAESLNAAVATGILLSHLVVLKG